MNKKISASLMCADLLNLEKSVRDLENAGVDYLHLDIMDGSFVPNITLGYDLVNAVKSVSNVPLDVHMMVNEPARFIDRMNLDENDILCVHYETDVHIHRTLEQIKNIGIKSGLAFNPQTPLEGLEFLTDYVDMVLIMTVSPGYAGQKLFAGAELKTKRTRDLLDKWGCRGIPIEVDGSISPESGARLSKCGADIFVLGTSGLFMKDKNLKQAATDFRSAL